MLVEVVPGETRIKKGEGSGGGTEDLTSTSPALGCLPPRGQSENKIRGVPIPPSHDPSK